MFKLFKKDAGIPIVKEIPAAAGTYAVGQTLAFNASGLLAQVAGTNVPEYICACATTVASGNIIAVNPVYRDVEYKTVFSADGSAIKAGQKVTIATTFDSVTATTTSGVAEVIEKLGTGASGTEVIVKF